MQRFVSEASPEWLDSLSGDSPLLSSSQFRFVGDVCSMIRRGMAAADGISPAARRTLRHDLPSIEEDFRGMVEHLRGSSPARLHFLRTYLGWRIYRRNTIRQLKNIAESIDKDKENCEIAKIVGSSISLLGGAVCLFSDKKKEQNVSQMIGSVMMGIGNLTTAGTSAVGTILLHENIQEAKKTVRHDKENLAEMCTWVRRTTDLLSNLDNVKSIGVDRSLKDAARSLQAVSKKNMNARSRQSEIKAILRSFNCPPDLRNGMADAVGMLVSTLMLCDRYRPVFDLAVEGSKCMPRLRDAVELFQSAAGLDTALCVHRSTGLTNAQRNRVFKGMMVDAVNIALTSLELDSKSVASQEIRQVACKLEEEAESFEKLYEGMKELEHLERQRNEYFCCEGRVSHEF